MSRWRNAAVDEWPTPREITFTTWGHHARSERRNDGLDNEFDLTPLDGLMLNQVPDTDLQALMETAPGDEVPESKDALYALREPLQDAVDALDDRSHWVFDAHVNRGLSFEDIAEELSVGKSTAHRIHWEAVATLKRYLSEDPRVQARLESRARQD